MATTQLTDRTCIRVDADPEKLNRLRRAAMANDRLVAMAAFMSAVANETRLRMLFVLWVAGELCVCDLADVFGISQPAVSRHLKILRKKALVETRRNAQTIFYSVCKDNLFARLLVRLFEEQEADGVILNLNISEHA
ncbi:MAG: metalloregulator ArsR/SmtB family transcription factor [Rhodothermales bacterium]